MDSIAEYIKEERDVLYLRGQENEKIKFITYLIREGNKTFEQIADIAGTTVSFVKEVYQKLSKN
jgi:hypothetical protein